MDKNFESNDIEDDFIFYVYRETNSDRVVISLQKQMNLTSLLLFNY